MSHFVTIQTQIRDPVALELACRRLELLAPILGTAQLFLTEARGWQVQLPKWRYPVVCDTDRGQLHYDHFGGRWGDVSELHRLVQSYAVEKTKLEARRAGHAVIEQPLADGSIRVQITAHG
ncbi:MAG TPA: DUF1257 domain-containing protein [Planctomycetaceae bacterium]|nr:DUF1257 domain-containing protein [Planctomycetaceae bacterium]